MGKAVAVGTIKGAMAGTIQAGVKQVWHTEHFQQEFTIDEFQHKWVGSGAYPIKLSLEQNIELINRYWANRTLKKTGEGNEYFNTAVFGNYLAREGFNKFHFLSLNMFGNYQEWFKEKLQAGVFVINDPKDLYAIELPRKQILASGLGSVGDFEEVVISNKLSSTSGWDNISHVGGGLYVYKDSYIKNDQGQDLMKDWLMPMYASHMTSEDSNKWVFKHPDTFPETTHNIPSNFFDPGKEYTRVDYFLHFFSSAEPPIIDEELHATQVTIERRSEGNKGIINIGIVGNMKYKRKVSGMPPANVSHIPSHLPSGEPVPDLPDDVPDQPDINIPEPSPDIPEPTPGEPEIPDPDIPTPDQDPGQDPDPNDPDPRDPDPNDPEAPDIPDSGDAD